MKKQQGSSGFSLIELMVAMVILTTTAMFGFTLLYMVSGMLSRQKFFYGRDRIILALTQMAGSPTAIRSSTVDPANDALYDCVLGGSNHCDTTQYVPFRLYPPFYNANGGGLEWSAPLTG